MESELADHLRSLASAYSAARGLELTTIGRLAAGDWRFFERLDDPARTFTARTYDRVVRWFSDNWPTDTVWPADVPRPEGASHITPSAEHAA